MDKQKERRKKLAKFASIVNGEDRGTSMNVNPVLPMNRYKYGLECKGLRLANLKEQRACRTCKVRKRLVMERRVSKDEGKNLDSGLTK